MVSKLLRNITCQNRKIQTGPAFVIVSTVYNIDTACTVYTIETALHCTAKIVACMPKL